MPFSGLLETVADHRRTLVVYAPDDSGTDLADVLSTRNLRVDHRQIPTLTGEAFVVVRDNEEFYGALSLSDLLAFLAPPVERPGNLGSEEPYRAIYDLLDNTVFVALDRRQLLATSRELEDRAWRTGHGRLHAGFQRLSAFAAQAELYRELATTTDVDVHIYLPVDVPESLLGDAPLTVHTDLPDGLDRYWFLLFDDGAEGCQNCALVARETDDGRYRGVWTYDESLVDEAFDVLPS